MHKTMNHKALVLRMFLLLITFYASQLSAQTLTIKESAPEVYVVKKGDTLWDISSLFLDKPWLWPELWRNNVHINNPHLIYPGDELRLRYNQQGEPEIVLNRPQKQQVTLSPEGVRTLKQSEPIPLLPWAVIKPYLQKDLIMSEQEYEGLPYLIGDREAGLRFATNDLVLTRTMNAEQGRYRVIRKQNEIVDLNDNSLGYLVRHVADATSLEIDLDRQLMVKVEKSNLEAKRGDKLRLYEEVLPEPMRLVPAEHQTGHIVGSLEQRGLLGKYDVAVLDLGDREVQDGTVMGIYMQGPNIYASTDPKYAGEANPLKSAFNGGEEVMQPAEKVGDLIIFKVFEKASYALITRSTAVIREGAIVAAP